MTQQQTQRAEPVTRTERRAAARLRVTVDKKLRRSTPQWIVDIANDTDDREGQPAARAS